MYLKYREKFIFIACIAYSIRQTTSKYGRSIISVNREKHQKEFSRGKQLINSKDGKQEKYPITTNDNSYESNNVLY